jgi:putative transposase
MLRAYKYRIYPTDEQKVLFAKTFGCCRFVYNWALSIRIEAYKQDKLTVPYKEIQDRMVNELKKENEWLSEVNSQSLLNSLRNLDTAYKNFFSDKKAGSPNFKSRKNRQSFQHLI